MSGRILRLVGLMLFLCLASKEMSGADESGIFDETRHIEWIYTSFSPFVFPFLEEKTLVIPPVPHKMMFCDIELDLSLEAKNRVEGVLRHLHQSPAYFNEIVEKCAIYMPFVERALDKVGVPNDLKYLVILESHLIGDAVSSSNAIGFWQFKEEAAAEVGLMINELVDERKHIYSSSIGAAKYLQMLYGKFDNWLYAVIGYNRGPRGALSYIESRYYGKTRMPADPDLHQYAIKALAYKIAFQDEKWKSYPRPVKLQPRTTKGVLSIPQLIQMNNLEISDFLKYNLWVKGSKLPPVKDYVYFVPRFPQEKSEIPELETAIQPKSEKQEPVQVGVIPQKEVTSVPEKVVPETDSSPENRPDQKLDVVIEDVRFITMPIEKDKDYGNEFTTIREGEFLVDVSRRTGIPMEKLMKWNRLNNYRKHSPGTFILLRPPSKARYHVVSPKETIHGVAINYGVSALEIRQSNNMKARDNTIYPGQKLYLRKPKPWNEKIYILR